MAGLTGGSSSTVDKRRLKDIVKDGLDAKYGGKLESMRGLELTVLHEVS